jgi:hypothetical protein
MENNLPQTPSDTVTTSPHQTQQMTTQKSLLPMILGGLALIIVGLGLGYYLGLKSNIPDSLTTPTPSPINDEAVFCTMDTKICPDGSSVGRVPPSCEFDKCPEVAQDDQNAKQSILNGYYKKYDGTQWEWDNRQVMCDSLVTNGGSEELIAEFRSKAESGNTLNKIIDNNFLINIDFSTLSSEEKILVEESSASKPIELTVARKVERAGGAGSTCHSLVDIISVKTL